MTQALDVSDITMPGEIGLDGRDMGYTLKTMRVALWCARRAADFEEALIAVVNAGGDTDTKAPWRARCLARDSASRRFRGVGVSR